MGLKENCDNKYGTVCDKCGKKRTDFVENIPASISQYETLCSSCFTAEGLEDD